MKRVKSKNKERGKTKEGWNRKRARKNEEIEEERRKAIFQDLNFDENSIILFGATAAAAASQIKIKRACILPYTGKQKENSCNLQPKEWIILLIRAKQQKV